MRVDSAVLLYKIPEVMALRRNCIENVEMHGAEM